MNKTYSRLVGGLLLVLTSAALSSQDVVDEQATCPNEGFGYSRSGNGFIVSQQAQIYRGSQLRAPKANKRLPALTPVACYAGADTGGGKYRVLISTEVDDGRGGTQSLCGWIDAADLLQQKGMKADDPCPGVAERKIRDYFPDGPKKDSPLNLKLLIWNINIDPSTLRATSNQQRPIIPAFDYPGGDQAADVSIYNVFPVFDFRKHAGEDWFLIGANDERLLGWVRGRDAVIWDNRLSLFFKNGEASADIYYRASHLRDAARGKPANPLASPPANLGEILKGSRSTFPKFPVLVDQASNRRLPYYRIAFIAAPCSDDDNCTRLDLSSANDRLDIGDRLRELEQVDILFLIDATESMDPYFDAVASAVKGVTVGKYADDIRIRVGAAMYGDYTGSSTAPGAELQYKTPVALEPIYDGDELEILTKTSTFGDPKRDKPEAAFGALLEAVRKTNWRKTGRRLIVHIGDHGPRTTTPPKTLLDAMRERNIMYVPIAVTGRFSAAHNKAFVDATQAILDAHKTPGGHRLGLTKVLIAYDRKQSSSQSVDETRLRVRKVLDQGLAQGEAIAKQVLTEIYSIDSKQAASADEATGIEAQVASGFARMTPAIREIFGLEPEKIELIRLQGQLVAPGFVAKFAPDSQRDQWDYFVALDPEVMPLLDATIGSLCLASTRSSAKHKLVSSIQTLTRSMTGDQINDNQSLYEYLENVLQIPLATETILRQPIGDLQAKLIGFSPEELKEFKKRMCKSALLFKLANNSRRLAGEPRWNEDREQWEYDEAQFYRWTYAPESGSQFVYLPLTFFPK